GIHEEEKKAERSARYPRRRKTKDPLGIQEEETMKKNP
ncbi:hypothetical protein AVEN_47104-1, partial [Araneus ventricosus]